MPLPSPAQAAIGSDPAKRAEVGEDHLRGAGYLERLTGRPEIGIPRRPPLDAAGIGGESIVPVPIPETMLVLPGRMCVSDRRAGTGLRSGGHAVGQRERTRHVGRYRDG